VNGAWMDTFVRRYEQVDINLVMGTGDGLITPVIRDVGSKGVSQLADELHTLEDSLFSDEEGHVISPAAELAPGTFSIHNLGMFGTKAASPIVLPPQSCALALGTITDTVLPCPANKWKTSPMMTVTLSCDHRVVDGAVAAQWLQAFKTYVENPVGMML
jgi:pyruvate dehydrogenase E2 component (dihydrolipoamide acetyltransferase)